MHDVAERAWLAAFIDGWLKRKPCAALAEAAE
jgi:GMP synthase (glutamine-hydrolysing)